MDLKNRLLGTPPDAPVDNPTSGVSPNENQTKTSWNTAERLAVRALTDAEREWQLKIHRELLDMIDLAAIAKMDSKIARDQIKEVAEHLLDKYSTPLNNLTRQVVVRSIQDEILGLGPLEPLLADPSITDILVNGFNKVYVERRGKLELTPVRFQDNTHLMNIIDRIVTGVGRRVDESSPLVDARLKDGSRVNAIIPPLSIDGPALSIRRFPAERLKTDDLIAYGSITSAIAEVLKAIVRGRLNVLISGGTGSGKTTLLNVMSGYIPTDERIVTIEDAAELQLQQPHVVRLETRPPNVEGRGEVRQRELVRNALRMRPERIILGEIRSDEAFDMLQAMNTGHDGSLATIHANTPRDALSRIENMVAMTGLDLPTKMVRSQIASAVNVVIQIARLEDGTRKMVSLQEIQGMEGDVITMSEIFTFERRGLDDHNKVAGEMKATGVIPTFFDKLHHHGINIPKEVFNPKSIR